MFHEILAICALKFTEFSDGLPCIPHTHGRATINGEHDLGVCKYSLRVTHMMEQQDDQRESLTHYSTGSVRTGHDCRTIVHGIVEHNTAQNHGR